MDLIKYSKKIIILILGMSVLVVGLALIVLPGPAFIIIPAGLAILATEFLWAKNLLAKINEKSKFITDKFKRR